MRRPSIPIVIASLTVAVTLAMLVGWTLVIVQNLDLTQQVAKNATILVLGIISFLMIIGVLVVNCVFLVRRIREVNRQYSFIDSVTHELKSPLASIKLSVETLQRTDLSAAHRGELQAMMVEDIGRLNLFIDDILTASRLAHLPRRSRATPVDLTDALSRSRQTTCARHNLALDAIQFEWPESLWVRGNEVALLTVFGNLMDNAVKYSRREDGEVPTIHVAARPESSKVQVRITDGGIGIPTAYRKRIFQRFYRIPSETVRKQHGTGLGLFVVAELVRSLRGKIRADSGERGEGAALIVTLPRAEAPA